MQHAEPEPYDLGAALSSAVDAYRDVYPQRRFDFASSLEAATALGAPELVIQMLDKLVSNAVEFSEDESTITISLDAEGARLIVSVRNVGPHLPDRMRSQLFDSMVSVRPDKGNEHLGLGLYVARLIAEGHGGKIRAENTEDGVAIIVTLPASGGGAPSAHNKQD